MFRQLQYASDHRMEDQKYNLTKTLIEKLGKKDSSVLSLDSEYIIHL